MESKAEVREKILTLVSERGLPIQELWHSSFPDFVPVVAKFVNKKSNRILTIEEFDDFSFDYAIRKTGISLDEYDLLLRFNDVSKNLAMIADIYKIWFIDLSDVGYVDGYLAGRI